MKTISLAALLTGTALVVASTGLTQDVGEPPRITVSGSASVRVPPDAVNLTFGIETRDKSLSTTRAENEKRTAEVIAALKAAGVKPEHIKSDQVTVEPRYEPYNSMNLAYYVMQQNVEVKLQNLDRFSELLMAGLEAGATHVRNVDFLSSELRKHRDHARSLALQAAREKAVDMARELGVKPDKVLSITEQPVQSWFRGGGNNNWSQNSVQTPATGNDGGDGRLSLGLITISADVRVVFSLE